MPQGGMNSDVDWKVFPEEDVIKVLNGRWAKTRSGVSGSVENIQGNLLVAHDYVDAGTSSFGIDQSGKRNGGGFGH